MLITLLTDFGEGSHYVAQMKGVIFGIHTVAVVVDISHSISPQDLNQAAFRLDQVVDTYPQQTCHVIVIDPGVGTQRRLLIARMASQFFIAPDNGCLTCLMMRHPPEWVLAIDQSRYWRQPVSPTFHGRDIMAPVAAHLAEGVAPLDLGSPIDDWVSLPIKTAVVSEKRIEGSVSDIDAFGNLITNIGVEMISALDPERLSVAVGSGKTSDLVATYGERPPGSQVALIGSGGKLEVAVVNGNAALQLAARVGDAVLIRW